MLVKRALVLNTGSSTLKWSLLEGEGETVAQGTVPWGREAARGEVLSSAMEGVGPVDAIGHRVVHGGTRFREAARIDAEVRAALAALEPLAPLHNVAALEGIDAAIKAFPDVPQVAVFDTAFHQTMPDVAALYAVPHAWTEAWGLRRFGFHGLSASYAVRRARELLGALPARLVVCHLGGGCSVTAVRDGRSVDTTMGFTPLEGVVMATRSGSIDPGLVLYLQRAHGLDTDTIDRALNEASGLLGVSGVSSDLRQVLAAADAGRERAVLAYGVFIHSLRRATGAMTAVLGGLDALVFTGGVGEHQPRVRREVAEGLAFAGVALDPAGDDISGDRDVSARGAKVRTLVITAREDLVVLEAVRQALGSSAS